MLKTDNKMHTKIRANSCILISVFFNFITIDEILVRKIFFRKGFKKIIIFKILICIKMAFDLAGWNDGLSYSLVDNCNAEKFDYIRTGDDSIINAVSIFSFIILKD